ncbi:Putative secreted protein [Microbacterium esteraromaticum]|uniref:Putative secreted protein n=1 Tax=Microbacterium esteraromaticum TaxID=57043 RepID=A0A1R4JFD8_9MICO|nr:DUF5719 family protein [Microbacterium esteraromaticum]SJN30722.1 Putative secreted protein [Microbacterium esteraromaticum]
MKQRTIHLAATGARVATGAVVAAACVLGVVAAVAAPWPEVQSTSAHTTVTPVPGDALVVCNGSFRILGRDSSKAGSMYSAGAPRLRVDGAADDADATDLNMPDITGGAGAQAIIAKVKDREAPLIAASESMQLSDEDARGFAAAPCREASMRSWLVGGDVTTGASDIILLSNPGSVPATVDLSIYGEKRAASTVVVPPMTQIGVPLASVAAGERRPVIDVVSTGAPVRATLQSTLVRTLDAVGADLQDGVSGAQRDVLLLGVRSSQAADGDDSTGIVVRMLAPDADAQAVVTVRNAVSGALVDEYEVELEGAKPMEIALAGSASSAYDIEIAASEPIVAGARQTARSGSKEDFAWMLPAPELAADAPMMFSVPNGPQATLYLRNTADEPITVTIDGPDGRTVELAASASTAVPLKTGGHTLQSTGHLHAAISMQGGQGSASIAGWPLWAGAATQHPIVVRP